MTSIYNVHLYWQLTNLTLQIYALGGRLFLSEQVLLEPRLNSQGK